MATNATASASSIFQAITPAASQNLGPAEALTRQPLTPEALGNEIITLFVGPKRKEFTLHKNLICAYSDFFSNAFNCDFEEAQKNKMYLPEDDPNSVAFLVDYIYCGVLPVISPSETGNQGVKYAVFYFLAEKYCIESLMNKLMDAIYKFHRARAFPRFTLQEVNYIYSQTDASSKLRQYCVAGAAAEIALTMQSPDLSSVAWGKIVMDSMGHEPQFFIDMFQLQIKYQREFADSTTLGEVLTKLKVCDFHVHPDGTTCNSAQADLDNDFFST